MSKFHFTLESVLRLRNQKRDECRRELGLAVQQLEHIESLDQHVLNEQQELRGYLKELTQSGTVPVGMVSRCHMHLALLERRHQQTLLARVEALRAVEAHREKLVAADQQVKAMEKVRDKQIEEHRREQDQRERLEQEEIQAANLHGKFFA